MARQGLSMDRSAFETSYQEREAEMMGLLEPSLECPANILGPTTLRSMSFRLDQDNGIYSGWERLAELMGFTNPEIYKLKQCQDRAAEIIRTAAMKHMLTLRQLIDIVHNHLGRRDVFTDEQIVKEILSDVRRHYRGTVFQRSYSLPTFYVPPLLSVRRFQGLNTDSFHPPCNPSTFDVMNSNLYADSMLYCPGPSQKEAGSTTSFHPPYGPSTFGIMKSNLYADSMLYCPGQSQKATESTTSLRHSMGLKESAVEHYVGTGYRDWNDAATPSKQGTPSPPLSSEMLSATSRRRSMGSSMPARPRYTLGNLPLTLGRDRVPDSEHCL